MFFCRSGVAGEDLAFLEPDPVTRKQMAIRLRQKRPEAWLVVLVGRLVGLVGWLVGHRKQSLPSGAVVIVLVFGTVRAKEAQ